MMIEIARLIITIAAALLAGKLISKLKHNKSFRFFSIRPRVSQFSYDTVSYTHLLFITFL